MAKKTELRVESGDKPPDESPPEETENTLQIRFQWTGRLTKKNLVAALTMIGLITAAIVSAIRLIQGIWQ